jgi:protein O-mannosyl-transferase
LTLLKNQYIVFGICALVTGLVALFCFSPAVHYEFTNWDDNVLVTQNTQIRDLSLSGVARIFSSFSLNHYHPLVTFSYAVEFYLFGLNPFSFHLTNIILHALNSILVLILIRSVTKGTWVMLVTGILFAIHPLRVESVVWIAERKDVLSAFFTLLALIFYIRYRKTNIRKYFFLMMIFFLGALLSKAMAVTLPVLFLAYDYSTDGHFKKKLLQEKIPLFFLSFVFGIVAIVAQYASGVTAKDPSFNIVKALFLVPYGLVFYIVKFLFPFHLSPAYPYPDTVGLSYPILFWLSPLIVIILVYGLYRFSRPSPLFLFAVFFYGISILPVLQIIPVGRMIAADRFSYVPLLGVMFAAGLGSQYLWKIMENTRWMQAFLIIISMITAYGLFGLTRQQISFWQSDKTLWKRVVQDNPSYAEGYNNLGITLASEGLQAEALKNLNYAIALDSTDAEYFYNRGLVFLRMKQWKSAILDYSRLIVLNPKDISAYALRGSAYLGNKSYPESIADYNQVLQVQPLAYPVRIERVLALVGNENISAAMEDISFLQSSGIQLDSAFLGKIQRQAHTNLQHH